MPAILARAPRGTLATMAFDPRLGERFMFEEADLEAKGPLNIRTTVTETRFAHVGQARFAVELCQAEALEEGAGYRVHYLDAPDGGIPLSLERT